MSDIEDPKAVKEIYRRFFRYIVPYWRVFVVAIIGMVMVAVTDTGFVALIKPVLDGGFVDKDPDIIRLIPLVAIGIFIFRGVGTFIENYYMAWIGRSIVRDLRKQMFTHLLQLPTSYYDSLPSGQLTSKLIYDVEQIALASTRAITVIIRDSLTIFCLVVYLIYINWVLSIFILVMGPMLVLIVSYVSKRFRKISKNIQGTMSEVTGVTQEAVDSHRVVKAFGGQKYELERFGESNSLNFRQNMKMVVTTSLSVTAIQLMAGVAFTAILYVATLESTLETVSVGIFMSFLLALTLLFAPLKRLSSVNAVLQKGIAAAQSIFLLLDSEVEKDLGTEKIEKVDGEIIYQNVSFSYDDEKGCVLHEISFKASYGQTIAFVGRSGSGKTSLLGLLPRYYDVSSGQILLGGHDIQNLTLACLRNQIALVSQNVILFDDTIANNIAYGQLENFSKEDIIKAAEAAHATDFINALPNGLDTRVGADGIMLSGGQRQRIAIARALLKNAPILILDEATSALDNESERHIQAALEQVMANRTTLVIAHRLSTIEKADLIIVMDQGKIVEQGTHMNLLAKKGVYDSLYQSQFRESPD
ncbi:MAG: lipid A export permease/ATP-binding protein MsbA [Gammaproteobacteria bacterium]|nr:lipid A export permease/ATP-binding protein MsbA [Gammaproteobacteria bacterium]